jgi:hypothetical protein
MAGRADAAPINRKPYVPMSRQVKGLAVLPSANNCQGSLEKAQPVGMASRIRLNSDAKPTAHTELVALAWAGSLADQARSYPVQSMVQTLVSLTDTEGGRGLTTSSESGSLLHRMSLRLALNCQSMSVLSPLWGYKMGQSAGGLWIAGRFLGAALQADVETGSPLYGPKHQKEKRSMDYFVDT